MPKLRLLLVTDEMEVGGTQRQLVNILTHLDRERFEPALLYFRHDSYLLDEIKSAGIPVYKIAKHGKFDPTMVWRIRQLYQRLSVDQIHCFSLTAELWCGLANQLYRHASFHTSIRGTHQWYSDFEWCCKRLVTRWSNSVVANSRAGSDYTASKVPEVRKKLKIIYNGVVKLDQSLQNIPSVCTNADIVTGLFVGRLVTVKNLPCLVRALAKVRAQGHKFQFLFVGDGPERSHIQDLLTEHQLTSHVFLLGERDDAQALMRACQFMVLPSHNEGLSNAVLEGMINGLAILASDVPGNAEALKNDVTGALFEPNNAQQLASLIVKAIQDPTWARQIGAAAKQQAERQFSLSAMIDGFMQHYGSFEHNRQAS